MIERISQLCERNDNQTLNIYVIPSDNDTPEERKPSLVWGVSKLVGGLALVGVNSLSWVVAVPPLAAISTAFGGAIAGSGATEVGGWWED